MFKAHDIMNTKVICVRPDMPIYEAIRLLTRSNLSGLPVVDEDLKLVGMLSGKDTLQLLYETKDDPNFHVQDLMDSQFISFDMNDNLIDLCDCLLSNSYQRIPITRDEMLAGIITPIDIIEAILKLKHQGNRYKNTIEL